MTLDFANLHPTTTTLVKWAPYRYNPDQGPDGAIGWENYPMVDYWDHMELVYKAGLRDFYADQGQPKEDLWLLGAVSVLRSLYMTLYTGMLSTVAIGGNLTFTVEEAAESSDLALAESIKGIIYDGFQDLTGFIDDFAKEAGDMYKTMKAVIELVNTGAIKTILGTTYSRPTNSSSPSAKGSGASRIPGLNAFKPSNFAQMSAGGKAGMAAVCGDGRGRSGRVYHVHRHGRQRGGGHRQGDAGAEYHHDPQDHPLAGAAAGEIHHADHQGGNLQRRGVCQGREQLDARLPPSSCKSPSPGRWPSSPCA